MLSTTIDWSSQEPQQMNGATENPTRPMSSFQIRSTDGRKLGSATAADQQAAAAAAPLKCPRCDSSNTKFCYYNNYSLSQPRHFCKSCKRYWTRGGMLRNVPVGGGCRKSKQRVRQPSIKLPPSGQRSSNNISHENGPNQTARSQGQLNQIEDSNLGLNGLLYGKNSANMEICNGFGASRVTDMDLIARVNSSSGYNQITNLGLGSDYMRNQYDNSSYPFSAYSNLFSSNLSSSPAGVSSVPPLMRSMLGNISGFEQEKFVNELSSSSKEHFGHFLSALPLEDMHIGGSGHGHQGVGRGMKVEELGQMNKFNQMGSLSSTSIDPSLQNWINGASNIMNTWSEVPNIGSSSVMSLL